MHTGRSTFRFGEPVRRAIVGNMGESLNVGFEDDEDESEGGDTGRVVSRGDAEADAVAGVSQGGSRSNGTPDEERKMATSIHHNTIDADAFVV